MKTIRVHNKGKRDYTIPPRNPGGEDRMLPAGRAIDLEEETAAKYIALYPRDLMYFEDLVKGDGKTASVIDENKALVKEVKSVKAENEKLKKQIEGAATESTDLKKENEELQKKIEGLYKDLETAKAAAKSEAE